jgi:hypothetical protein
MEKLTEHENRMGVLNIGFFFLNELQKQLFQVRRNISRHRDGINADAPY